MLDLLFEYPKLEADKISGFLRVHPKKVASSLRRLRFAGEARRLGNEWYSVARRQAQMWELRPALKSTSTTSTFSRKRELARMKETVKRAIESDIERKLVEIDDIKRDYNYRNRNTPIDRVQRRIEQRMRYKIGEGWMESC